jgi:selenide,water dikinase
VRLTSLAHGGGCGCKLSPAALREIMAKMPVPAAFPDLLVGTDTSDDAAVWRLNDSQALVATTDFFMPVVDDPRVFGAIAATNALSDVYAMGGKPIMALAIVGMPVNQLPAEVIGAILAGGAEVCAKAGVPVAGGHSIDSVEPIYGLVALGLVHPDQVLTNKGGRAGDVLVLTKGLGVGVFSAAFKQGRLDEAGYDAMVASTTLLNTVGAELGALEGVRAVTDVTGFGLLGHGLEMARGSGLAVEIGFGRVPLLPGAAELARAGVRTGASGRNWASYGEAVRLPEGMAEWKRDLLTDPQTSGGLLIAVAPSDAPAVIGLARRHGAAMAREIGRLAEGPAEVVVEEA